jgi:hypothetical protein
MTTVTDRRVSDSAETLVSTPRPTTAGGITPAPPNVVKGPGLGTKFFLAAALLVIVILGTAIGLATARANAIAERSIRAALAQVPTAIGVYRANLDTQIRQTLRPLGDDPGTKALLDPDVTRETVLDWTQQRAKDFHARTVFAFDASGVLVARSDQPLGEPKDFSRVRWVADALDMKEASAAIREGKALAMVAAVPVFAGDMQRGEGRFKGVIAASFALDDARAEALKGITGGQVGFLVNKAKPAEPPSLDIAAATPGFSAPAFLSAFEGRGADVQSLLSGSVVGPLDLVIDGDARLVEAVPIKSARARARRRRPRSGRSARRSSRSASPRFSSRSPSASPRGAASRSP